MFVARYEIFWACQYLLSSFVWVIEAVSKKSANENLNVNELKTLLSIGAQRIPTVILKAWLKRGRKDLLETCSIYFALKMF